MSKNTSELANKKDPSPFEAEINRFDISFKKLEEKITRKKIPVVNVEPEWLMEFEEQLTIKSKENGLGLCDMIPLFPEVVLKAKDPTNQYSVVTMYIYAKMVSENSVGMVVFSGLSHKKMLVILSEADSKGELNITYREACTFDDNPEVLVQSTIRLIYLTYCYILFHSMVEYEKPKEVKEIKSKKKGEKSNNAQKNNKNSASTNNIILKPKRSAVYDLNAESEEIRKKQIQSKTYKKESWFVHAYFQRYGKDKKPKFIPARVNHRRINNNQTTEDLETKMPTYMITNGGKK